VIDGTNAEDEMFGRLAAARIFSGLTELLPTPGSRLLLVSGENRGHQMEWTDFQIGADLELLPFELASDTEIRIQAKPGKVQRSTFLRRFILVAPDGKAHTSGLVPEDMSVKGPFVTAMGVYVRQGDPIKIHPMLLSFS
jgi:hypothetical protein